MKQAYSSGNFVRLSTIFGEVFGKIVEISDDRVILKISDMDAVQNIPIKLFNDVFAETLDIDEVQFNLLYCGYGISRTATRALVELVLLFNHKEFNHG